MTPGPKSATVKLTLTNTGNKAGAEVVPVYLHDEHASVKRPEKELKGFKKVLLQLGEAKTVTLNDDAFQYYSEAKKQWVLEPGRFDVLVGSSSRDIRLTGNVTL